jgi:hypothetical protein
MRQRVHPFRGGDFQSRWSTGDGKNTILPVRNRKSVSSGSTALHLMLIDWFCPFFFNHFFLSLLSLSPFPTHLVGNFYTPPQGNKLQNNTVLSIFI